MSSILPTTCMYFREKIIVWQGLLREERGVKIFGLSTDEMGTRSNNAIVISRSTAAISLPARGWRATSMDEHCQCDNPDASLLRVVMIGEIIRADETDLYGMAEVLDTLGFMHLSDSDVEPPPQPTTPTTRKRAKNFLRRVK
jgi:hypothetical protein